MEAIKKPSLGDVMSDTSLSAYVMYAVLAIGFSFVSIILGHMFQTDSWNVLRDLIMFYIFLQVIRLNQNE